MKAVIKEAPLNYEQAVGGPTLHFVGAEGGLEQLEAAANLEGLEFAEHKEQDSGAIYRGYLKNGLRHGPGQQIWQDGATYRGEWSNDKANG